MAVFTPHEAPSVAAAGRPAGERARPAWALLAALTACLLYAAFADGATGLPEESWLQVAIAAIATVAIGVALYGGGLRAAAGAPAWAGVVLLVLFAAWTGASIAWSVAPDRSWMELNRGIAYVLAVVCGILVGSSLPRAIERTSRAMLVLALPVALYALGGKTLPGLHISGLFDLDHAGGFNRLKAPLEYWNALAMVCVIGLLPALRLASDPSRRPWPRVASLLAVYVLVLVVGMTYSRGGILAMAVGLAVFLALTTERVRALALFLSASIAASLPMAVSLSLPDLITDRLPLERRQDDALIVFVIFLVAGLLLALWGRAVVALERRRAFSPERGRRIGRPAVAVLGVIVLLGFVNAAVSGGLADTIDSFTDQRKAAQLTDPNRLLSANSGNRWTWWKEAAGAWSDKPVAGWGAGSFPVTHKLYRRELLSVQQPHSVPLQWMAETGIIGLLLAAAGLLSLVAAGLLRVLRMRWAVSGAPSERGYGAALIAIAAAWIAHSFYDWDWDIPAVTLPMLVCLGVAVARPVDRVSALRPVSWRAPALVAAVVAFVLVVVSALLPALAERRTQSALTAIGAENVTEEQLADAASDAEVAARLNPLAVEPIFAASTIAERRGRVDEAREHILRAIERQPSNVEAWVRLARFEFQRLDREGVRRASMRALQLDPVNPGTIALARRAFANSAPPNESATATGSPLPKQVPITSPEAGILPSPTAAPVPSPSPTPTPTPTPVP